jgi:periplasmic protein TonB
MSTLQSSTLAWPPALNSYADAIGSDVRGWTRRGPLISIGLHGLAIAALLAWSVHTPDKPAPEPTVTLVMEKPIAEPIKLTQPKVEPAVAHPVAQKAPPPRPVAPVQHAPQPRTVAAPAAAAQVAAPPAPVPQQANAVDPAPAAPAAPVAPAAPAGPRVIGQEGIPSDYVNQVFSRINHSAGDHYPRIARLKHLEGRVGYKLTLAPDGSIVHCDIHSSGDDTLDTAATDAIHAAAPFPHLPDLGGSSYVLAGAIVYQAE